MSSDNAPPKQTRLCGLCENKPSKYCCPQCDIFYCSLDCYKSEKHGECSENFYRECVQRELLSQQADDASKTKMIDILKRIHENCDGEEDLDLDDLDVNDIEVVDSDDDSQLDLHERIQNLNLNDPDALWNALTEDERNEFEAKLKNGEVDAILPQWEPWWSFSKKKKLVEDVEESKVEAEILQNCPSIKSVPDFGSLTSVKPSPAIRFNMANVLASYAFIMRYFNGEIEPIEAVSYLLDICTNLSSNTNFEDAELAVESVTQKCLQSELIETNEASLDVMRGDTFRILEGPSEENKLHYSKSAFSHLIQILTDAKAQLRVKPVTSTKTKGEFSRKFPEHDLSNLCNLDVSKVKKAVKKLEYYLSFLNSCHD